MEIKDNKINKLSKAQIQRDSTLLKKLLFNLIDDLYKDLKTITRPFVYINSYGHKKKGVFNFNLTKLHLVDIIFESMIKTAQISDRGGSWVCVNKLCKMVEEKLCNTKYIVLEFETSYNEYHSGDIVRMIYAIFCIDLCDKLISVAKEDQIFAMFQDDHYYYFNNSLYREILKEDYHSKPIIIDFKAYEFEESEFEEIDVDEYNEFDFSGIKFKYISFKAVNYNDRFDKQRTIRIEDLIINSL